MEQLELRPAQRECLRLLAGSQCLAAILPTGYGKSLIYQYAAREWGWRVLVLQPLIALMDEQAQRCREQGLRAKAIHSALTPEARREVFLAGAETLPQIVFMSPERWLASGKQRIANLYGSFDLIVIDEAHCLWQWSQFRPAYARLRDWLGSPAGQRSRQLLLSATISRIQERALRRDLPGVTVFRQGLGRQALSIKVSLVSGEGEAWFELFRALNAAQIAGQQALIFISSRVLCEEIASALDSAGFKASYYHAELPPRLQRERLVAYRNQSLAILVTTSALSMGIDLPGVEWVIHWGLPGSLNQYWQEVGRAGRESQRGSALMIMGPWEFSRGSRNTNEPEEDWLRRFVLARACRRRILNEYFGNAEGSDCKQCDRCFIDDKASLWWWRYQRRQAFRAHEFAGSDQSFVKTFVQPC